MITHNNPQVILPTTQPNTSLRGIWRTNEPLAPYTSWRAGGCAKIYYRPADLADLAEFLRGLPADEPILWLGLGSNLLIRDGGFPGVVIHLHKCLAGMKRLHAENNTYDASVGEVVAKLLLAAAELEQQKSLTTEFIRIEAGVTCAKIARFCAKSNLLNGEFFAGIPGTMGGALAMNAGAFGNETWKHVVAVEVIDRMGKIHILPADSFQVSYRAVTMGVVAQPLSWVGFVAGYLQFPVGDGALAQQQVKELLNKRNTTQPIGQLSCGSVFKNPPGTYAAKLVEACGLKGMQIGAAYVSSKHANFIINAGTALATDIEALIELVQARVLEQHGIKLETEVKILGVK